jgi:hypothetical protein
MGTMREEAVMAASLQPEMGCDRRQYCARLPFRQFPNASKMVSASSLRVGSTRSRIMTDLLIYTAGMYNVVPRMGYNYWWRMRGSRCCSMPGRQVLEHEAAENHACLSVGI